MQPKFLRALFLLTLAVSPNWCHGRDVQYSVARQVSEATDLEAARRVALEAVLQLAADETSRLFLRESTLQDGRLTERARLVGLSLFTVIKQDARLYFDHAGRRTIQLDATVRFDDAEVRRRLAVVQGDFQSSERLRSLVAENQALRAQLIRDPGSMVDESLAISRSGAFRSELASVFAPGTLFTLSREDADSWRTFCATAREKFLVPLGLSPKRISIETVREGAAGRLEAMVSVSWPRMDDKLVSGLQTLIGKPAIRGEGVVFIDAPDDSTETSRRARFLSNSRVHLEIHVGAGVAVVPILVGVDGFNSPIFNFAANRPYTSIGERRVAIVDGRSRQTERLPSWAPVNPLAVHISETEALNADRVRAFVVIATPDGIVTRQQIPI